MKLMLHRVQPYITQIRSALCADISKIKHVLHEREEDYCQATGSTDNWHDSSLLWLSYILPVPPLGLNINYGVSVMSAEAVFSFFPSSEQVKSASFGHLLHI